MKTSMIVAAVLALACQLTGQPLVVAAPQAETLVDFKGKFLTVVNGISSATTGAQTLAVAGSGNTTLSGIIANGTATALAITKTGAGTLTLNGSSVNTYTGSTTVNGGIFRISFANLATPTNSINSSSALSSVAADSK